MFIKNAKVNIYKKTEVIYEGQPPGDLNVSLEYDEDVKFQVESDVSLTGDNIITITGELDGSPVSEEITCTGLISEGSSYFDNISSLAFSFEDDTAYIKIRGITSSGDNNPVNILVYNNIDARVRDLKWSKVLYDMGVIFKKSKMAYMPNFITLDNSHIIEYEEDNYSIFGITRGVMSQEVIISRID